MLSTYVAMDISVEVLHHQYLASFSPQRRQASKNKRNNIAKKGKNSRSQNNSTA
jgi:hypothetical protein